MGVLVVVVVVAMVVVVMLVVVGAEVPRFRTADAVVVVVVHVLVSHSARGGRSGRQKEPEDVRWRGVLHGRVLLVLRRLFDCTGCRGREVQGGVAGQCVWGGGAGGDLRAVSHVERCRCRRRHLL